MHNILQLYPHTAGQDPQIEISLLFFLNYKTCSQKPITKNITYFESKKNMLPIIEFNINALSSAPFDCVKFEVALFEAISLKKRINKLNLDHSLLTRFDFPN